ncbi:MAG: hypothetical protein JW876_08310 [Candidatus Krumholzibacteriota bacterium]|nr:hypothetical protein [Candidatus Krumholzibacteriota bacterium]
MGAPRTLTIILLILAAGLLAGGSADAQVRRKPKAAPPAKMQATNAPMAVFRGLEAAWRAENADALARHVGEKRVYLSLPEPGGTDGFYSQSQVYYLFKKMFKSYRQVGFEFVKFHNVDKPGRRVYGIATRSWKDIRSGRIFTDRVYVTLRLEGSRWVVAEIKTAS